MTSNELAGILPGPPPETAQEKRRLAGAAVFCTVSMTTVAFDN